MAYITDKIRNEARLHRFRDALSGAKETEPPQTLKDFGVTDPIDQDDMTAISKVFGNHIHKEQQSEESVLTGKPVPADDIAQKQPGLLARMLAGGRSDQASRAETVISRSSTAILSETSKQSTVSLEFHNKAVDPANNANPEIRDVNAVQMVMENVFDWDFHERHHGDTVTPQLVYRLMKSLQVNLKAACPSVSNDRALELFEDLAANNWVGDIVNLRHMTERLIDVYLDAQNGNTKALEKMERFLQGALRFNERFYAAHQEPKLPLRTIAQALERQGERPSAARLKPV